MDQTLAAELVNIGRGLPFNVVSGKTVCANDFYEGMIVAKTKIMKVSKDKFERGRNFYTFIDVLIFRSSKARWGLL